MFICAVVTAATAAPVSRKRRHIIGPADYSEYIYDDDYYNEYNEYHEEYNNYYDENYYNSEYNDYHNQYNDYYVNWMITMFTDINSRIIMFTYMTINLFTSMT